ncbi:DUF7344 domain-containing protein [Salinarchaeum laminariae]|uniref:DUF7344 domain-containing protein n=1 Tax=Salinarchaeum laminariae TaxID=869888 RepID=UPI0020BF9C14|nr:hypothetical protein [Salinarchaeum laminariae]
MTAEHNTNRRSDNSDEQLEDPATTTARTEPILSYLQTRERPAPRAELIAALSHPAATINRALDALEERGAVAIDRGEACDLVQLIDADDGSIATASQEQGPVVAGTINLRPLIAFDILGSRRRREFLRLLASDELFDDPRGHTIVNLGGALAAREIGIDVQDVSVKQRSARAAELKDRHLPLFDDYDVVEWDRDTDRVRATDTLEQLVEILNALGEEFDFVPRE